jgi:flavodoxin
MNWQLAEKLGADKCEDISSIDLSELQEYDTLIVGAPTWCEPLV